MRKISSYFIHTFIRYKNLKILNLFFSLMLICSINIFAQQMEHVFIPEKVPEYPGGEIELQKFISDNLIYPKEAREKGIEKMVIVNLIIEEDGTFSNINLFEEKYDFGFGEEAIRIVKLMPKWKPGQIDGKKVRTKWMIFVQFSLDNALNFNKQAQNVEKNCYSSTNAISDNTKIPLTSYAQLSRFYIKDLPKYSSPTSLSNYQLYLDLCDDGSYYIHVEQKPYFDMIETGYTISIGKYEVKNNILVLTDAYTQCKMSLQLGSSPLKSLKTFPFIKEIQFKDYSIGSSCCYQPYYRMKETTAEKLVKEFEAKNVINNPFLDKLLSYGVFMDGTYRWGFYPREKFELKLDKDKKYEFSFKVSGKSPSLDLYLIISSGTWERQGNILTLWDTNLQHKFYGLIRKDGSIELLFFRWVEDMIFKKM